MPQSNGSQGFSMKGFTPESTSRNKSLGNKTGATK